MKIFIFLSCLFSLACNNRQDSQRAAHDKINKDISDSIGFKEKRTLSIDSSFYLKSDFSEKGVYKPFKKTDVVKIYGYSHVADIDYQMSEADTLVDKKIFVTDSLIIYKPRNNEKVRVELTKQQISVLFQILNDSECFAEGESGCFFPRHTFVLVNKLNTACGLIEICFQCSQIYVSSSRLVKENGLLSSLGKEKLEKFCKEIEMNLEL